MWYERKKTGKGMSWAEGVVEDDKSMFLINYGPNGLAMTCLAGFMANIFLCSMRLFWKDFTNLEAKAQTEVDLIVSPGGNAKFVQGAGAPSMSQSTNGRSNSKENEGKEVQGNCLLQRERTELQN
ncbi:hypothetical protein NC653_018399 [Populus alba x Populus x berolinensis]|uniref:Uncharacterized protein n=1 Tax=Populus alba x Populus x berolinensis TaxID=444605 RepID=A0AAD6QGF3_9ROSI|nr:hypothetical protein NC653_018392 [Populus alba x Populus x berolinensis]KAJ6989882.1 hypothetical protein NC653_018399 [Populus alba x Populus x berolinensis]